MIEDDDSPGALAGPLRDECDLTPLLERIGDARVVCIGEASHGTHEFYEWRAALTRRLVQEHGFDFVAVEGDWPDCYELNRCLTGSPASPEDPRDVLESLDRWPTWMWGNDEVLSFARWLRSRNLPVAAGERVGFYGLDVYSLWQSIEAVLEYVRQHHPAHVEATLQACRCLEPYAEDPHAYARESRLVPNGCEVEVVGMLSTLLERQSESGMQPEDGEAAFAAQQNAYAAVGAEAYYRAVVLGGPESWNIRDTHMADTLDRLLDHHSRRSGRPARAVVWEHNTHIGDARHTDMADAGMVNVGQLVRERYGEDQCVLVGFASHRGTVIAAEQWGRVGQRMTVPPARPGSAEAFLHDALEEDALFVFPRWLPGWATEERPHRAIGVVYHPHAERWGNYVPSVLGRRYDALLWLDETTALHPLSTRDSPSAEAETWPSGQ